MICGVAVLLTAACSVGQKSDYEIVSVPFNEVHVTGGFWSPVLKTVQESTIPFAFEKCEQTGRISNFAKAAGLMEGDFEGMRFNDSDVFKIMEGAAYSLAVEYDPKLDAYLDSLITLIAGAQEPDGYLYTIRTIGHPLHQAAGAERWSYIQQSHELYNVGHMYEAAVAHYEATGKTAFLEVAKKNADLLCTTFMDAGRRIASGHQEVELALVKLYRVTHEKKYLDLAKYLLDCRGEFPEDGQYRQDHMKVIDQREAVGHAVRAVYMYMGMADVAALTGDQAYLEAIDAIWEDVVSSKMYVTGGIGSRIKGESFGDPYELPNDIAYCETCAAIAFCMWNLRMFCLHGDSKYIDVLERALYNNVLDGISPDGKSFFYPNVLECNENNIYLQKNALVRSDKYTVVRESWFDCSCCPSNLARFLPSVPGYIYAADEDNLFVNLFVESNAEMEIGRGRKLSICQQTEFPWNGHVVLDLEQKGRAPVGVRIRIPGWASGKPVPSDLYSYVPTDEESTTPVISLNGKQVEYKIERGYACLHTAGKGETRIEIEFPLKVHFVAANEKVINDRGKVAIERGPLVYCAEQEAQNYDVVEGESFDPHVYQEGVALTGEQSRIELIPYYMRGNRGLIPMRVFLEAK